MDDIRTDPKNARVRLAHLPRLPHLPHGISWSEWTRRLPHVDFQLPNTPFHWPSPEEIESWPKGFAATNGQTRGGVRRRQLLAAATLVVLLVGFRLVDQAVTRWSVGSTPVGQWAGEAAEWSGNAWSAQLVDDASAELSGGREERTASAGKLESAPQPASTGENAPHEVKRFVRVVVTGYSSSVEETDGDPLLTASNTRPQAGTLALSRDLLRTFTPGAPFDYGDKILIPGVGVYRVEDTMSGRWRMRADLWFESAGSARQWGQRAAYVSRIPDDTPILAMRPAP